MKVYESPELPYVRSIGMFREKIVEGKLPLFICRRNLRRRFNVPANATKVWFVIHNRPHKDRVRLDPVLWGRCLEDVKLDGKVPSSELSIVALEILYQLFKEHGSPLYAEIWYE